MELVRENENVGADEDSDNYDAYRRGKNQIPSWLRAYFIKKPRPERGRHALPGGLELC